MNKVTIYPSLFGNTCCSRVIIINTALFHSDGHPIRIIRVIWSAYLWWVLTEREHGQRWNSTFNISV